MANLRNSGKKTVFTNGCFDILHAGHIKLLASAKNLGDFLVVGLNSDKSVKRIKGPHRPLNTEKDRAAVLSGLESVDAIVLFGQDTPLQLIKLLRPAILVKGADYGRNEIIGSAYAGKTVRIKLVPGRSTTAVLKKMKFPAINPQGIRRNGIKKTA